VPSILVVGSLAYDDVRTPVASRRSVLGGAASYFAVAASRYAPVRLVGVVGSDFRDEDVARLRESGIDLRGLERREGRSFRWQGTYDFALDTAETINTDLGVFGQWRPRIPDEFADSDIVSINEGEARQLCETFSVVRAAREILGLGPRVLVVKRGEHGATLFTRTSSFWAPAFPLEEVADPTGAGDTFAGGFMGHLAECGAIDDSALRRAVLHGTVCASFAVERFSIDGIAEATKDGIAERYRVLRDLIAL
jgi:sugar/nucleoside kinase (ribokinase family)